MPRTIVIPEPKYFYSAHDEDVFFGWIYFLPGFIEIVRKDEGLHLKMKSFSKDVVLELIGIMTRYGLDMRCLVQLCNLKNEEWLKDKKALFYSIITKSTTFPTQFIIRIRVFLFKMFLVVRTFMI